MKIAAVALSGLAVATAAVLLYLLRRPDQPVVANNTDHH